MSGSKGNNRCQIRELLIREGLCPDQRTAESWILAGRSSEHRIVEVKFDPIHARIYSQPDFPIFVSNALHWLTNASDDQVTVELGADRIHDPNPNLSSGMVLAQYRPTRFGIAGWGYLVFLAFGILLFSEAWRIDGYRRRG